MTEPAPPFRPSPESVEAARRWVEEWDSLTDEERAKRNAALAEAIAAGEAEELVASLPDDPAHSVEQ